MRDPYQVRLSNEERLMIEAIAKRDGVSPAQAIRTLIHQRAEALGAAPKVRAT